MDDFKFKEGQRLPLGTLMETPEMSYTQELLNTPIPIENRIAVLLGFITPDQHQQTIKTLSEHFHATDRHIRIIVDDIGLKEINGKLPEYSIELIEEELHWDALVDNLPEELPAKQIANILDRQLPWVRYMANDLAIFPRIVQEPNNRERILYPKSLVSILRHIMLLIPLADDWQSLQNLHNETGRSRKWIKKILDLNGIEPQDRMANGNHNVSPHYPPHSRDLLKSPDIHIPMAGEWMTINQMSSILGHKQRWVKTRLEYLGYSGELRRDDTNRAVIHYSPGVLVHLKKISESEKIVEDPNYISEKKLAANLGRSWLWVRNRAHLVDPPVQTVTDLKNVVRWFYPLSAEAQMRSLPSRQSAKDTP